MFRTLKIVILLTTPLLTAALWMDKQPSFKPYEAPIMNPPAGSVPVTGKTIVPQDAELRNPVAPTASSLARGKQLFTINCAMCHGQTSAKLGLVGNKLVPPAPALEPALLKGRSDSHIFKAITLGFGRMPVFNDKLLPDERWDVVNFLRTRN
jgi:mono/diheme cytochrome c family protein